MYKYNRKESLGFPFFVTIFINNRISNKIEMEKFYNITIHANPALCIVSILFLQLDEIPNFFTAISIILFFINIIVMIIIGYKISNRKKVDERNIAGQVIAAIEAEDYVSALRINLRFKKGSILGTAFSFYILGLLSERSKEDNNNIINHLDSLRDYLFANKK